MCKDGYSLSKENVRFVGGGKMRTFKEGLRYLFKIAEYETRILVMAYNEIEFITNNEYKVITENYLVGIKAERETRKIIKTPHRL